MAFNYKALLTTKNRKLLSRSVIECRDLFKVDKNKQNTYCWASTWKHSHSKYNKWMNLCLCYFQLEKMYLNIEQPRFRLKFSWNTLHEIKACCYVIFSFGDVLFCSNLKFARNSAQVLITKKPTRKPDAEF